MKLEDSPSENFFAHPSSAPSKELKSVSGYREGLMPCPALACVSTQRNPSRRYRSPLPQSWTCMFRTSVTRIRVFQTLVADLREYRNSGVAQYVARPHTPELGHSKLPVPLERVLSLSEFGKKKQGKARFSPVIDPWQRILHRCLGWRHLTSPSVLRHETP